MLQLSSYNYTVRSKNVPFLSFYFCNNFVKPHYIFIIFGTQILIFNITKLQQNCPPLLMAVLTLPCETKGQSVYS